RAAILSDEYAKMYDGLFTLRFEDTSPSIKPPQPEAYEAIKEDLRWLGIEWDYEVIQSDRLPIYYDHAERLLRVGGAYICTCSADDFRKFISERRPCPCRGLPVEEQLDRWKGMLGGVIRRGGAVMRVKTILDHPNPAVRDWPAMRIDTKPHPRIGNRYRVWPLYNFASGIDDHLLGITHILRGKEHEVNMVRQKFMYDYFGWEYPEAIHYGRLKIEGTMLSKSKIRAGIDSGTYESWDDPRLGTISALRKRGFLPETVRRLILEVGVRPSEATISWENLSAINRKILDPMSKRYVFIEEPVNLRVEGIDREYCVSIPLHPDRQEWGARQFRVCPGSCVAVQSSDLKGLKPGSYIRLMNLFNVEITSRESCRVYSEDVQDAKQLGAPIVQWLPGGVGLPMVMVKPDASRVSGLVDPGISTEDFPQVFQFYRYGFVRVYRSEGKLVGYFAHN
ncbi:MAG: glutamate--tRNA ligase, partial [Candidatus Verstraetearchaeota archaeon]|nr:glutamate--tRNA ligase [Candidatus Verstraetearchaeota archaeon]